MTKKLKNFCKNFISTISHYGWTALAIIPVLFLINWSYLSVVNSELSSLNSQQVSLANEKINTIHLVINDIINNVNEDAQVLIYAAETQTYLNTSTPENLESMNQLFYRISSRKPPFLSVEYLDLTGEQIVEVFRDPNTLQIKNANELTNKSNEDYFTFSQLLAKSELYMLPLELVNYNDEIIPVTGIITPVYDELNTLKGYLAIHYNANYIMNIFNQNLLSDSRFIEIGIVNNNIPFGLTENFETQYQKISSIDTNHIIDLPIDLSRSENLSIYNDDDFFHVFALIDHDTVVDTYGGIILNYPIIIYLLNILVIIGISYLAWVLKSKSDNRVLLNANMYLSNQNLNGVIITNNKMEITYGNQAFEEIYGYKNFEYIGRQPGSLIGKVDNSVINTIKKEKKEFNTNSWNISKKGIMILKNLKIKPETDTFGQVKHYLTVYSDPNIDFDYLAFMSQNESRTTYELLARAFDGLDIKVNSSCVMIIRLYNEKSKKVFGTSSKERFNSYGFAEFLKEHLGPKFKISIPKETYTIIYTNLNKLELEFQELIDSIDSLIDKYKQLPNVNAALEYNFGVAKADNKSETKADLISNAFIALQMSKLQKNIKHLIYTEEVEKVIKKEKLIFDQLEYAFNNDEFYLQYQIQKDIKNSKYVGVEALLRWDSSILGNVSPVEFIKVIENSFFINRLSIMVLGKVIKDFTPYIDLVNENFRISINLTYFDFFNDTIINSLVNLIEKSPFSPKNFCFEITESGYIENKDKTNEIIDYLHSKGIIVAIDDFGTGFSSLEVLKSLNVDKIKIDRSFIKDYPISDDGVMFKIIANLVKTLGFSSIVEGAETKEQIDLIIKNGIIEVQGYFVSKPLYIENLVKKYLNTKSDF